MARPPKFKPIRTKENGWRLNVPAGYSESGNREQRFFPTREKAEEAAKFYRLKKEDFGKQAKSIRPSLAEAATKAEEILKPYGISIIEAAKRVAKMESLARASQPIPKALEAFLETKENKSASTKRDYGYMARDLTNAFGDRVLSEITGPEIMDAVEAATGKNSTFNRRINDTARFLKWAAKKRREWVDSSIVDYFENKEHKKGKVEVLLPSEVRKLLRTAERYYPDTVIAFVLMVMMGVRPSEVTKMSSDDITEDGVTIPDEDEETGEETKTGRRFIQMTPVVAKWLKAYPAGERITPQNWDRKWDAVRRLAGWAVSSEFLKGTKFESYSGLPQWKQDVLRHTAATMMIALGKPMSVLIFEHGHTLGESVLKKHYSGKMTIKQANEILSLEPNRA